VQKNMQTILTIYTHMTYFCARSCLLEVAMTASVLKFLVVLVSPDGVAPSQMVGVSASVNLPLHH